MTYIDGLKMDPYTSDCVTQNVSKQ